MAHYTRTARRSVYIASIWLLALFENVAVTSVCGCLSSSHRAKTLYTHTTDCCWFAAIALRRANILRERQSDSKIRSGSLLSYLCVSGAYRRHITWGAFVLLDYYYTMRYSAAAALVWFPSLCFWIWSSSPEEGVIEWSGWHIWCSNQRLRWEMCVLVSDLSQRTTPPHPTVTIMAICSLSITCP